MVGPALHGISVVAIPVLARVVCKFIRPGQSNHYLASLLMTGARVFSVFIVPLASVILLSEGCMGLWLKLWKPCHDEGRFDIEEQVLY